MQQYNPVKYYFDHHRAPPVNQILLGFEGGVVPTPRQQYHLLANAWKYYIHVSSPWTLFTYLNAGKARFI